MATASARQIAVIADLADTTKIVDRIDPGQVFIWRGETVQIRVLCALNGMALDLSNIASLTCEVKTIGNRAGSAVMSKTVASGSIDPTATLAQFSAGTGQHCIFEFSNSETNITLASNRVKYWMVIHGFTTDNPSKEITYAADVVTVEEDGAIAGQAAPVIEPLVVIDETDSPYAAPGTANTILVETNTDAVAISLPDVPVDGQRITVKDVSGNAATNAITITDPNAKKIDAQDEYMIADNYAGVVLVWSATLDGWFTI